MAKIQQILLLDFWKHKLTTIATWQTSAKGRLSSPSACSLDFQLLVIICHPVPFWVLLQIAKPLDGQPVHSVPLHVGFVLKNLEAARFLKCQLSSWFSGTTTYDAALRAVWMTVFHQLGRKILAVFYALSIVECITSNSMWVCPDSRNFRSMTSILSSQNCMVESCNEVVSILSGPGVGIQNDMLHCVWSVWTV